MGNQKAFTSPSPEKDRQSAHADMELPGFVFNEVRESVGHVNQNVVDSVNGENLGPSRDCLINEAQLGSRQVVEDRPSYVTLRPNQFDKKARQNSGANIPDLNNSVELPVDSDPFNIEEILRMEAQKTVLMLMPR
ncbi:hypothetical protein Hanom_Chr15g01389091 [Helianthus anomalus]